MQRIEPKALQRNSSLQFPVAKSKEELKKIVVYVKPFDDEVIFNFQKLFEYVHTKHKDMTLLVEKWVIDQIEKLIQDPIKAPRCSDICKQGNKPGIWLNESEEVRAEIDFLVTMGGDGTILWASKQFHTAYVPPIISFGEGSLGYLCNFDFSEHKSVIDKINKHMAKERCFFDLDTRFRLRTWMEKDPVRDVFRGNNLTQSNKMTIDGFHILNEVVIDRGPFPVSIQLDILLDGQLMTTLSGDGLIVATPTGSTAYNMSAAGSIV